MLYVVVLSISPSSLGTERYVQFQVHGAFGSLNDLDMGWEVCISGGVSGGFLYSLTFTALGVFAKYNGNHSGGERGYEMRTIGRFNSKANFTQKTHYHPS